MLFVKKSGGSLDIVKKSGGEILYTSRKRKIRPKFNLAEYRSNGDQICAILKSIFLAQLGCHSSYIRTNKSTNISNTFDILFWVEFYCNQSQILF